MVNISKREMLTGAAAAALPALPVSAIGACAGTAAKADAELIALGKRLEALYARDFELREMLAPYWEEHDRRMKALYEQNGGSGDELYLARDAEVRRELGAAFAAATDEHGQVIDDICAPAKRMFALPARSLEGLAVKARMTAIERSELWAEPFRIFDWHDMFLRNLVEAVLAMVGESVPAIRD